MPFRPPQNNPLTENQSRAISKLGAIKTFLSLPTKADLNVPKPNQISSYDFLLALGIAIVGANFIDSIISSFFTKIFSSNDKKLERMVLKSTAESMDANGKTVSDDMSNKDWLFNNVLPSFNLNKRNIANQIITMIFGPKNNMVDGFNRSNPDLNDEQKQIVSDSIVDISACAGSGKFFSLSNDQFPQGDLEFNQVQLRKQLEEGNVVITISCKDVKIKLPGDYGRVLGVDTASNPGSIFINLSNFMANETQRQDTAENANAVRRSSNQILVDKTMNLMSSSVEPQMKSVFDAINSGPKGDLGVNASNTVSNPCVITGLCESDPEEFKKKSAFSSALMNLLYTFIVILIFRELSKRIKGIIKKSIAKSARRKRERLVEKQKQRFSFLGKNGQSISRAGKFREALRSLDGLFESVKDI